MAVFAVFWLISEGPDGNHLMVSLYSGLACLDDREPLSMKINVKLIGLFQTGRFKQEDRVYPEGSRVEAVVEELQLPSQHFGIILVNGVHAARETVLKEGDSLVLMPIVDGG